MIRARVAPALLVLAVAISGCSAVPNLDSGSAGCQNARGIGRTGFDAKPVPIAPLLIGKSPVEAASIAAARGHTVVFNVQITGYGECWCTPPPMGTVTDAWWGEHGALWLRVSGVDVGHSASSQPFLGWGC